MLPLHQASQYSVCDRMHTNPHTHRTINAFTRSHAQTCIQLSNRTHYFTIKRDRQLTLLEGWCPATGGMQPPEQR